jgi:hypothetical protein
MVSAWCAAMRCGLSVSCVGRKNEEKRGGGAPHNPVSACRFIAVAAVGTAIDAVVIGGCPSVVAVTVGAVNDEKKNENGNEMKSRRELTHPWLSAPLRVGGRPRMVACAWCGGGLRSCLFVGGCLVCDLARLFWVSR